MLITELPCKLQANKYLTICTTRKAEIDIDNFKIPPRKKFKIYNGRKNKYKTLSLILAVFNLELGDEISLQKLSDSYQS